MLSLFGQGIHESLTRTMGAYLEATAGRLSNANKSPWEKEIASRMIGTNNPAESPFALQTSLAETPRALAEEIASFGSSKTTLRTY